MTLAEGTYDLISAHRTHSGTLWEAWDLGAMDVETPVGNEVFLSVVLDGQGIYERDDALGRRIDSYRPGMATLTLPTERMKATCDPVRVASLAMPFDRLRGELRVLAGRDVDDELKEFGFGLNDWPLADRLFRQLATGIDLYPCRRDEMIEAAFILLLPALLDRLGVAPQSVETGGTRLTTRQIEAIRAYVEENLTGTISVNELSRHAGTSARHLSRLFKATFGVAPYAWVQSYRLRKARTMLRAGMGNVTAIAFECGFASPSDFAARYRQTFGRKPSDDLMR